MSLPPSVPATSTLMIVTATGVTVMPAAGNLVLTGGAGAYVRIPGSGATSVQIENTGVAAANAIGIGVGVSIVSTANAGVAIGKNSTITADALGNASVLVGSTTTTDSSRTFVGGTGAAAVGSLNGTPTAGNAVSSTVLGYYALAQQAHQVIIARGAFGPDRTGYANIVSIGFSGASERSNVYFFNGHTSKYVDTLGGTQSLVPSSTPIAIHGYDAYDATVSPTNNVAGGDLELWGGLSTGTAQGGRVRLRATGVSVSSSNTQNTAKDVASFYINSAGAEVIAFGTNSFSITRNGNSEIQITQAASSSQTFSLINAGAFDATYRLAVNGYDWNMTAVAASGLLKFRNVYESVDVLTLSIGGLAGTASVLYTTEATSGGAGSIKTAGGIYAAKKIIATGVIQGLGGFVGASGGVGLTQASTATLGKSITVENGLITAFA